LDEVHRFEGVLTVYRDQSDVVQLNRVAAEEPCAVSEELFELLLDCRRLHETTCGAFDVASQSLMTLWRDCRAAGRVPTQAEIDRALARSGTTHLRLERVPPSVPENEPLTDAAPDRLPAAARDDPAWATNAGTPTVRFDVAGLGLNFNAIGKGAAIDRAAAVLRAGGIADFVVHGGHSSLHAAGSHAGQAGWPIGLKNPLFTDASYLTLLVRDRALGTSGSNIQFFRHQGRRYGHILDPRTGWPAESLLSASVLAPTAAEADALSTAFYVLGLEKSLAYCHTHRSVAAILTPPPTRGRRLTAHLVNVPDDWVFPVSDDVDLRRDDGSSG